MQHAKLAYIECEALNVDFMDSAVFMVFGGFWFAAVATTVPQPAEPSLALPPWSRVRVARADLRLVARERAQ